MITIILIIQTVLLIFLSVMAWKTYKFLGGKDWKGSIYEELEKLSTNFFDFFKDWLKIHKGN